MNNGNVRLQKLAQVWPPEPCPACASRPGIVCIAREGDPVPDYPEGICPTCGRRLFTVPVLTGVDCEAI